MIARAMAVGTGDGDRGCVRRWMLCKGTDALQGYGGSVRGWMLYSVRMLYWGSDAVSGTVALPDHTGMQLKSESALAQLCEHMQSHHTGVL